MPPIGVLLVNVGSPDAPETAAVRRYLAEFLGDPGVVRLPRWLWLPLLHGIVLPLRGPKSAALYRKVWTPEGSPLITLSAALGGGLQRELGDGYRVEVGMRYGNPSIAAALERLKVADCRDLVLVPMFPQYSCTTSGTVIDAVRALRSRRGEREPLVVSAFFDDPEYVAALAHSVRSRVQDSDVDHYVFSFHGLPLRTIAAGDPYREHCERTAAALAKALDLPKERWTQVYQSRFGREEWLRPYAADVVPTLAQRHRRVVAVCPAFTTDCLETLEEVRLELGHKFRAAGGQDWTVVPCLNDDARWVAALAGIVRRRQLPAPLP
ncbi:MAG: ferrochelatase [Planctomycetes bacterium]|nr:ferrochelatase [Planctomycetota bacterium]